MDAEISAPYPSDSPTPICRDGMLVVVWDLAGGGKP